MQNVPDKFIREELPYRQGAVGLVVDDKSNILLVQKVSFHNDHAWGFPGGGVDEGELPKSALLRELEEELGSSDFVVVCETDVIDLYEWPKETILEKYRKKGVAYRGQQRHQYIVKFVGKKEDLQYPPHEITAIKWVPKSRLKEHLVFDGQWENAEKLLQILESCNK